MIKGILFLLCLSHSIAFAANQRGVEFRLKKKLTIMVNVLDDILNNEMSASTDLCGPDEQLGYHQYVTGTECCQTNADGQCIATQKTRMKKVTCVRRDENGVIFDSYQSFGEKEYGECLGIEIEDPAEVITPL